MEPTPGAGAPSKTTPAAAPAAPAGGSEAPATRSAVEAAVGSSTSAYQAARRAERAGKPLPAVAAAQPNPADSDEIHAGEDDDLDLDGEAPAGGQPAPAAGERPKTSKRSQQASERTQRAVEAATQDLRRELAELRGRVSAQPPATPAAEPPKPKKAAWREYYEMPDAPKLEDVDPATGNPIYESVAEHTAAMSMFISEKMAERRTQADARGAEASSLTAAQMQRVEKFAASLDAAKVADPKFTDKLTPKVRQLKPLGALQPGEPGGPLHILCEQIQSSPIAPKVLLHLSEHPEAFDLFEKMPAEIAAMPPSRQRTRAHIEHIVRQVGKLEGTLEAAAAPAPAGREPKHISDAPDPPVTLGSRPTEAGDPMEKAIKDGNTGAYRRLRLEQRAAMRR
jgi:hypothetical protein